MKLKKLLILMIFIITSMSMISCDYIITFNQQSEVTTMISTLPVPVDGTITFNDSDYDDFPVYISPTYSLTDINEYNQVLYDTQDHIRHANIDIVTTLYEERYIPWNDQTTYVEVGGSSGSGFVFMEDDMYYYAITNNHVINDDGYTAQYEIKTYSDETFYTANLLAYDADLDLAVIRFDKLGRTDIELIDIYKRLYYGFNPGEMVIAVGNPLSVVNNVTFGEFIAMQNIDNVSFEIIYHNASIHEGSSGGALVDVDGNLLGVNTWGLDSVDTYSFSIPNYIVYMFLINNGIID